MKSFVIPVVVLLLVFLNSSKTATQKPVPQDLTQYVNPFIGTAGTGHTFPGATLPFGMVQLSPDTRLTGWEGCSGYHYSDDIIYGFSHTHLSGTGISDYGDILVMPTVGEVSLNALDAGDSRKGYASRFKHENETAEPGYYRVKLDDDNITAELTATKRAGLHRYTYPGTTEANVIIDLAHRDKVIDSGLKISGGRELSGWRRSEGWAKNQIVYFAAEFSQPFTDWGMQAEGKSRPGLTEARGKNLKAYFRFDASDGNPVLVRVGLSSVSVEGARRNLAAELNHWSFEQVKHDAARVWNNELIKIQVTGGTKDQLTNFYTALYHTMIAPNVFTDVDGSYLGRDFKVHKAKGFDYYTVFSLWDTFRAVHPLYAIIDQKRTADFINTFLTQSEQGGRLPVWELAANETDTMIGYHAVSVIADAAVKGIPGFDRERAFAAMKHSAQQEHFGLKAYRDHGYIGMEEESESVSKTLEYAYDDWCIAEMARILGRVADYNRFIQRAQSYKNVFDPALRFMRPRSNGGWLEPFSPREVDFNFTEANAWQYTFFVPHDISGLMGLMGGKQKFAQKLDEMFSAESRTTGREQADITGLMGQYAHGNEPSHHMAYLYNYAGQPWKTQSRVRMILDKFYKPEPDGLIGNEDCGQMSAWYVFSAAGFYPVTPGSPVYAIGSPLFPEVRFNLENGKQFVVKARGVSQANIYIQAAQLNGSPYNRSYLKHEDVMNGGELIFEMGSRPNQKWGTGENDIPVSNIAVHPITPVPVIEASGRSFRGRLKISMYARNKADVYYTTDGSEPHNGSLKFRRPFFIDRSSTIRAVAYDRTLPRLGKSLTTSARYHKIPHNWTVTLTPKYSSQYPAAGDLAVIDGIRGTTNWSGGAWQGYRGQDFVAVVDLGRVQTISKLGAGFLQDVGSWIWMPRRVEFEVSADGHNFVHALSIQNDVPDKHYGVVFKDLVKSVDRTLKGRYIRIKAHAYGKIPDWHPGHGEDSWLFIDEILIE